jgi:hypothetical protein
VWGRQQEGQLHLRCTGFAARVSGWLRAALGYPGAERNLLNLLSDFEDVWQVEQDAEGMNNDIDLTRETLHLRCSHKHFVRGAGLQKKVPGADRS